MAPPMARDRSGAEGLPPLPPLDRLRCCADFEVAARGCLGEAAWEYISGGEEDTIERNRSDFASFLIRPRVLRDVSHLDISCSIFGVACNSPFYLSSVAKASLVTKAEGEKTFVRAAAKFGTVFLAPTVSSLPLKDVWGATAPGQRMPFQFYLLEDEEESFHRLHEAIHLGASAVVVTVDANAPRAGVFARSTRSATGVFPSPHLTWARLLEVKGLLPPDMPLYLKGVQTAEDALEAVRLGVRGIIVSNHGGRCCSEAWGSLSALQDVAGALRKEGMLGNVELLFDSGIRSGRDALKALCLGAQAVGLGRPYYWAAASYGEEGVVALLRLMTEELRHAMAQAGAPSLTRLSPASLCELPGRPRLLSPPGDGSALSPSRRPEARL